MGATRPMVDLKKRWIGDEGIADFIIFSFKFAYYPVTLKQQHVNVNNDDIFYICLKDRKLFSLVISYTCLEDKQNKMFHVIAHKSTVLILLLFFF